MIHDQITELLRRKQQIDQAGERGIGYGGGEGTYTLRQRWMVEAVELLLKIALEKERES